MLACTALVGCTDDDIIQNGNEMQDEVAKMDTYVTISIDASTSSSRTTNDGDEDGNAEHSGHTNAGSVQENAINQVLVILTSGEYKEGTANGIVDLLAASNFKEQNGIWTKNVPYRMDVTGDYKALIVINPVDELVENVINSEENDYEVNHAEAYKYVCNYAGKSISTKDGKDWFMMANQKPVTIKVDETHNSPENAAGQGSNDVVNVERATSKITFRWKAANEDEGIAENVYPVKVNTKVYQAFVEELWYIKKDENNDDKYYYAKFNVATAANNETYYILLNKGETVVGGQVDADNVIGIFQKQYEGDQLITHYGHNGTTYVEKALLKDVTSEVIKTTTKASFIETLSFTQTETTNPDDKTYYIKLEQYALTNLSKTVYAVRHVSEGTKDEYTGEVKTMELLNNNNVYLIDPYSKIKSENGYTNETAAQEWFTQTLKAVEDAANTLGTTAPSTANYFKSLPSSYSTSDPDTKPDVDEDNIEPEYNKTGAFLAYCNENAVLANKQVKGLVTGIVFVGKIYSNKECTAEQTVQKMYKYDNIYYETLRALLNANPGVNAFANLTENSSDAAAKEAGIVVYNGGTCFYYSSQIEHYDNDGYVTTDGVQEWKENGPGIMENAIMRNNIYSLSIKGLKEIGSAELKLDANESTADMGAYITMQAKILPWIVRFNDIEF